MLKKTAAVLITVLMLITLCSCAAQANEDDFGNGYERMLDKIVGRVDTEAGIERENDEAALRAKLEEYSGGKIVWFMYNDYDGDGVSEAFAFTGAAGSSFWQGKLWYVNENYAAELKETGKWNPPELVNVDGTIFLFAENYDDVMTYVFGIENSKVYETAVSGMFSALKQTSGADFTAEFTSYDYYEDETEAEKEEPTTKLYWFYVKDGEFYEYGADNSLKRADLKAYATGAEVISEIYESGLTKGLLEEYYSGADEETLSYIADEAGYFHSIMLRENGIINLNFYGAYEDCFYITFKIEGGDAKIIDQGRGFYLPAAVEAIATYPERDTVSTNE
jgi:hypothetical protein